MDSFYDEDAAGEHLKGIAKGRMERAKELGTCVRHLGHTTLDDLQIIEFQGPKMVRVCDEGIQGPEETHFRMFGVVCDKRLPPVSPAVQERSKKYLKQSVTVTGIGCPDFERAIESLEELYIAGCGTVADGAMEAWMPRQYRGHKALEASTPYFTWMGSMDKGVEEPEVLPFNRFVVPNGTLAAWAKDGLIHTADNNVSYVERVVDTEGVESFRVANPMMFRIGDIVEVTIAINFLPIKGGKMRMLTVLRSLALLDHRDRDKAAVLRMRNAYHPPAVPAPALKKRRSLYEDERLEATNDKMKKMRIDEAT